MIFKRPAFITVLLFAVFTCGSTHAQINIPSIVNVLTDPSGTCASPGTPLQYNTQLNHLSACQGASPGPYSWALVSGGGGGAPSGPAGGDLGGTYPNPTVTNGSHITNGSIGPSALSSAITGGGVISISTSTMLSASDCAANIIVPSGTVTLTLANPPPASVCPMTITTYSANNATVARNSVALYVGTGSTSNITLTQGQKTVIVTDGTNYYASNPQ